MSDGVAVLLAVLLLAGNASFVGAEFALITARRAQIEPHVASGRTSARWTLRAMEQVSLMLAGTQLGITVCSLLLGAVGEPAVAHLLEPVFAAVGLPENLVHPVAFVLALVVVVTLHMVLGEMVPKNIAIAGPERSALALVPPLFAVVTVLRPVIWLLNQVSNLVLRHLVRVEPQDEVSATFTADEVEGFLEESQRAGLLDADEHELLSRVLEFPETTVEELVRPVTSMTTVSVDATVRELEDLCARSGFSRFPVVAADGDLRGYLHVKDVLDVPDERVDEPVPAQTVRPLRSIAAGSTSREALNDMRRAGAHLATVHRDGELLGLVSLGDVVEELVGEVAGEPVSG
jgi:CBS domain containing-hemolysin-like protein